MGGKLGLASVLASALALPILGVEVAISRALSRVLAVYGLSWTQATSDSDFLSWLPESSHYPILSLVVLAGVRGFMGGGAHILAGAVTERFRLQLRRKILFWGFHDKSSNSGKFSQLFTEVVIRASDVMGSILGLINQVTATGLLLVGLFLLSVRVTAVVLLLLMVLGVPVFWMSSRNGRLNRKIISDSHKMFHRIVMSLKNLLFLRLYGAIPREFANGRLGLKSLFSTGMAWRRWSGVSIGYSQFAGMLVVCTVVFLSSRFPTQVTGTISGGAILVYLYLLFRFVQGFVSAVQIFSWVSAGFPNVIHLMEWESGEGAITHLKKRVQVDPSVPSVQSTSEVTVQDLELPAQEKQIASSGGSKSLGAVGWNIKNLTFFYKNSKRRILTDFSTVIMPGSFTTIIGSSGAGKSTLLSLLVGEVVPASGDIQVSLNGVRGSIRKMKGQLSRNLGYVGAESFLLAGSIRENLLLGVRGQIGDSEIAWALERAECGFIYKFDQGLEHQITDHGEGLSAGQKQRLCLARAILRKPKALILDEATANLDHETERRLVKALLQLKGEITIVAATHRTALREIADQEILLGE